MDPTTADPSPTLPRLEPGVTHLRRPSPRSLSLHRIVVNEVRERAGGTLWIDARNNASTYALYDLAPSPRSLDGVRIARAFTAYQHHSLVRDLPAEATPRTGLIVAPCVASLYEDDDLQGDEGHDLLRASLSILRELAATLDVPVLLSSSPETAASASIVEGAADATIEATSTDEGVRYSTDDFETLVYWNEGYWQTTIPYWVDLLGAVSETAFPAADPIDLLDARA